MSKTAITSAKAAPAIGPYSTGTEKNGMVFLSGITGVTPETAADVAAQTEKVLVTMAGILEDQGLSMDDVMKCTVFLKDLDDFAAMNAVYARHFAEPYPARLCVQAAKIPAGALVEIDAIAVR